MAPAPNSRDEFWTAPWRKVLAACGYANFEVLWGLDLLPLDTANQSRGGVSAAALLELPTADAEMSRLVVKRQRNHQSRTWRHPIQGIPTLQKEFTNLRRFARHGLNTVTPVYFAQRHDHDGIRAILITEYLEGYRSLDNCLEAWANAAAPATADRRESVLHQAAVLIARMHRLGLQHNCLYPKHLFVDNRMPQPDVRLIDLEKAGKSLWARRRMTRDLGALFRRSAFWTSADQERFMVHYHGAADLTPRVRRALRRIQNAMATKTHRRARMKNDR